MKKDSMRAARERRWYRPWVAIFVAVLIGAVVSAGCNTWAGLGEDIQSAGKAMQGSDDTNAPPE